jgi:ureidoglycolate lyase
MPSPLKAPSRRVVIEPLTPEAFAPFGSLIQNPVSAGGDKDVVAANQGSALKYMDISELANFYHLAPSRKPARPRMNMFVCSPRSLRQTGGQSELFDIKVLERHPYTTQTFLPLGVPRNENEPRSSARYLVIVAPTLPVAKSRKEAAAKAKPYPTPDSKPKRNLFEVFAKARPSAFTNENTPPTGSVGQNPRARLPKGAGMPDLENIRAFLATGDQAITYGAGTWHSPMAVVGPSAIDFVVVQNMNEVGLEDCQEIDLISESGSTEGLTVVLDLSRSYNGQAKARL